MRSVALISMLTLGFANALSAQGTPAVAPPLTRLETGSCPACLLRLEPVAVVGRATDAQLINDNDLLFSARDGGFYVADQGGKDPILRYDWDGHYLGTLGRLGDGPGEYLGQQSIADARGDSITVWGRGRLVTISATTGRGRTNPIGADAIQSFRMVALPDGSILFNNSSRKRPAFAVLKPTAAAPIFFGPSMPEVALVHQGNRLIEDQYATDHMLALAPGIGVWAVRAWYEHRVQLLAPDGKVLLDINRHPAWHVPYDYAAIEERLYRLGPTRAPLPPHVVAAAVAGGHLYVVSTLADANWKKDPNAPAPNPPGGERPPQKFEPTGGIDRYIDTIIEVYDAKTGAFQGSWRADKGRLAITQTGLAYYSSEDEDGVRSFNVFRVVASGK